MKIGLSSWSYPYAIGNPAHEIPPEPMHLLELAEKAAGNGAEVLQVADNLPVLQATTGELDRLRRMADEQGMALEIGTAGLDHENLLRHLDIALGLGASLVRTLPHRGTEFPTLTQAQERLSRVLPRFETAGVVLGIENHDHYPSAWIRQLIDSFSSPWLGVCLDAVNNLGLGESFREVLEVLAPVTVNFHCKDYAISRKPSMLGFDVVGQVAGEGFLDLALAYSKLPAEISWIIESWLPWQGTLKETLSMEEDWAVRGLANLRAFRDRQRAGGSRADAAH